MATGLNSDASGVIVQDVQSLVFSAHGSLPHSVSVWLGISDPQLAKEGLRRIANLISFGIPNTDRQSALQLLFSAVGLQSLGVAPNEYQGLSRPFRQGIAEPHRSRALGDRGRNDPQAWVWNDTTSHAVALCYAKDQGSIDRDIANLLTELGAGWQCIAQLATYQPTDSREHFGFRDGISKVHIDLGDGHDFGPGSVGVPAGEILLGHRNASGRLAPVTQIARDGVYVAIRQLAQDVSGFWEFWRSQGDEQLAVWLASKAVGRWPNGMPVSGSASQSQPEFVASEVFNSLSFRDDVFGDVCPRGAHIRRANPRDGLTTDPKESLELTRQHQMIRRGRLYGSLMPDLHLPSVIERREETRGGVDEERGLLFVALCSDLTRQFEFVQQSWLNDPKFSGEYDEVDPLAAGDSIPGDGHHFSIPRDSIRQRLSDVRRWVTVRGGGYFLLVGRSALRSLI